jgi:transposase
MYPPGRSTRKKIPSSGTPLKKVRDTLRQLRADYPGKRIEVWFQDETRFGQQGTVTRQWALKGTRPIGWKQTQYEYLYVLGAVCPHTGQTVGLLAPSLHTDSVNAFFGEFQKEVSPEVQVLLIWDQAGFHTSDRFHVPPQGTLMPLPPYSPQLNPVEKLWQYLRKHYWSNRVYENYETLRKAAVQAWQQTCLDEQKIKSICRANYVESEFI